MVKCPIIVPRTGIGAARPDILVLLEFCRRAVDFDLTSGPVPAGAGFNSVGGGISTSAEPRRKDSERPEGHPTAALS